MKRLPHAATAFDRTVTELQIGPVVARIGDPGLGSDVLIPAGITDPGSSCEPKRPDEQKATAQPLRWPLFA